MERLKFQLIFSAKYLCFFNFTQRDSGGGGTSRAFDLANLASESVRAVEVTITI
jgi:hypothetical protein